MPMRTLAARPATRHEMGSGLSELRNKSLLMSDPKSVRGAAASVNQGSTACGPSRETARGSPHSAGFDELLG